MDKKTTQGIPLPDSISTSIEKLTKLEVTHRVEKFGMNSYECGKAGNRHKIYYKDIDDLKEQLNLLRIAGLLESE